MGEGVTPCVTNEGCASNGVPRTPPFLISPPRVYVLISPPRVYVLISPPRRPMGGAAPETPHNTIENNFHFFPEIPSKKLTSKGGGAIIRYIYLYYRIKV